MFEGPFSLSSNQNCVLCGSCIKTCPNQSPVLNLRLPGYDLWSVQSPDKAFGVLGIALIGTQLFRGVEETGWLGLSPHHAAALSFVSLLTAIGAFLLAALYTRAAGQSIFGKQSAAGEHEWYKIVYALLPLAFAFEAGYHLNRLLTLGGQVLPVLGQHLGVSAELPGTSASPALVKTLQMFLVLLGTAGSAGILGHLIRIRHNGNKPTHPVAKGLWPVLFLALIYLGMFLAG
jgi:ferredoxin